MSGIFGVVSKKDCGRDVFYGADYHSHLGTQFGGMDVLSDKGVHQKKIHTLSSQPFRAQFESFAEAVKGKSGIGVISDYEVQPVTIDSHLGQYSIVHVGKINNLDALVEGSKKKGIHFSEMGSGEVNPTELIATLIDQESDFVSGIEYMQDRIEGSSSLMLLTNEGIYLARDKLGRTPIVVGKRDGSMAATLESTAFPNLGTMENPDKGFEIEKNLGPGEIGILTESGFEQLKKPGEQQQICSFLWVYYGYPSSTYEGINAEVMRNRSGEIHGLIDEREGLEIDMVAGIPDSGTGHAIGYANARPNVPYGRPIVKYTPSWPRSFMPQNQSQRNLVAKMKLVPIAELIEGKRLLFLEDSIVRGTQLRENVEMLFEDYGAKEIHMRPACPPLIQGCIHLNFSRSRSERDLAGRRAMEDIEGTSNPNLSNFTDENSEKHGRMVDWIRADLKLTSLRYQRLDDMVRAIGLPKEKLCLDCWGGGCNDCSR